jgi:hypothetical protein
MADTDIGAVLIATDGVTAGVNRYGLPQTWRAALDEVIELGADPLVNLVDRTEDTDPEGTRWPRSKCHDDKALVTVCFAKRSDHLLVRGDTRVKRRLPSWQ